MRSRSLVLAREVQRESEIRKMADLLADRLLALESERLRAYPALEQDLWSLRELDERGRDLALRALERSREIGDRGLAWAQWSLCGLLLALILGARYF